MNILLVDKKKLKVVIFMLVFCPICACRQESGRNNNMEDNERQQLLGIIGNSEQELPSRMQAIEQIALSRDTSASNELKKLLNRPRPEPEPLLLNWDPVAAERVVDLHIVEALHVLGDDSELGRIPALVRQAGDILIGSDNELHNAASVILRIGRVELIQQLVVLTGESNLQVVSNAVRTLNQLDLPQSPMGGEVSSVFATPDKKFTFEIQTLKQELETLAELSEGQIRLSTGTREFLESNDYDRGAVRREHVTLAEIVEQDFPILEFDYYIKNKTVVVCTHKEAGQRWQNWWQKYGKMLMYNKEHSRFELTDY